MRESEQEDAKVKVDNNVLLKEIPHGFYGDEPAGIWQPVKLSITDPTKVEDVFIKPTLNGATFDVTLKNYDNKQKELILLTKKPVQYFIPDYPFENCVSIQAKNE